MAEQTWTFDAPTGVYKNHDLSQELREAAIAKTQFMEHVRPVEQYGKGQGESVTLTKVSALNEPSSADLSETERIPEDELNLSTTQITVTEIGRAVPYTSLADDLSVFNLENPIQNELRKQLSLVLDTKAAEAFKSCQVKYAPTGATSNNISTNGSFGAQATENLNMWHVEEIRDYLFDTLKAPMVETEDGNASYIGIFRTLGLRGLKRDDDFEEWQKYTDPQNKFNSEVGRWEGIRFMESNHENALGKVGNSDVLGEGVVFGDDAVAMAEAQTPELRAAQPDDFGRRKAVAWYGILELAEIWQTANAGEARIVHVGSQ